MRTTATGALLIQIPGSESSSKADALAGLMKEALINKEGVKVSRPVTTAEIRVWPLEPSITKDEVIEAVISKGNCQPKEIQVGEIKKLSNNMGSLWFKLPLAAAKLVVREGSLCVGWIKAKVALLDARPLRCFRCLEQGHTREKCPSAKDRSGLCYRCGSPEHIARVCSAAPKCPICADIGRKADHVLGSKSCTTRKKRGIPVNQRNRPSNTEESPMEIEIQSTSNSKTQSRNLPEEGDKKKTT
ncbi:uncharacterized protein [Cardiocondyla obscurior]|uniref:uncharacterized protein n=1 Tax=Cardiocondyla obscurior TaxID=286306 RepID=UPI0039656895